jgi:hypothetical protein
MTTAAHASHIAKDIGVQLLGGYAPRQIIYHQFGGRETLYATIIAEVTKDCGGPSGTGIAAAGVWAIRVSDRPVLFRIARILTSAKESAASAVPVPVSQAPVPLVPGLRVPVAPLLGAVPAERLLVPVLVPEQASVPGLV